MNLEMQLLLFRRMQSLALQFQFGIPVGKTGAKGDKGDKGDPGDGVTYAGAIDATTAAEPTDPKNGDFYVNVVAGTSTLDRAEHCR